MKKFFVTTAIYYVNDEPHIGGTYEAIAADALARFHRMRGEQVLFSTGTDENAQKVSQAAAAQGVEPQEFVDRLAGIYQDVWGKLNIQYDRFIRTAEPVHRAAVQSLVERWWKQGDIYQGAYKGWYCLSDETFFRESELVDGCCPNAHCGRKVEWLEETGYFFRLSAYQDRLLQYIEEHPSFLRPDFRRNEVISFIRGGLRDIWISRCADWGIPLPAAMQSGDQPLVVYVWFDALINYLTVAGFGEDDDRFREMWPADLHIVGKDIFVRFHATLWPAMLMAAGLPLPESVFAHGFWQMSGEKISKSRGHRAHPVEVAQQVVDESGCRFEIATDALRYFVLREIPFGADGDFSLEGLLARFNSDLANDLGNLLNRTLPMIGKYCDGIVPSAAPDPAIAETAAAAMAAATSAMEDVDFAAALKAIWVYVGELNRYVDRSAPWKLAKAGDQAKLDQVMGTLAEGIRQVAVAVRPFMPNTARLIGEQLGWTKPVEDWQWADAEGWGLLPVGTVVQRGEPIFPRVEQKVPATPAPAAKPSKAVQGDKPMITFQDFQQLDLRVAEVKAAAPVPGADKLLQLTIDLGDEERTIVAGIALCYTPEELVGKKIIVLANLEPATIRGVQSQGMLLAAGDERDVVLLTPERDLPAGKRVR